MKIFPLLLLLLTIAVKGIAQPVVGSWLNTGPVPFPINVSGQVNGMGRVSQIKFHPSNPAKIYAVSSSGGLFITNDTGKTWAPTAGTEVLPTTACSAVCIDYTNDNILYLSTGDQNYYSDWYGIYKSTDGGLTWNPSNTGIGTRMCVEIIMDPANHNNLIAATDDGIWKTTNAGALWTETLDSGALKSMKQRPGSNQVLYAATGTNFFKSTDMGNTWALITSGVSVPSGNEGIRIAVTPADTNIVYLGTTGGYGQILKSTDGGNSFAGIYSSSTQCIVCYDSTVTSGSQGYYNFNLTVNPTNASELLLGSHCVWRSTDGGLTWSWRTQWWNQIHTDMHDLEFDPYYPSMRFNANDGGVWLSFDTLATYWTPRCDGLSATEMYHAAQSPVNRQLVSAGTQDNGELFYDGQWKCNRGGDWGARCGIDYSNKCTVYYDNGNRRDLAPLGGDYSYNAPFTTTPEFHIEFPTLLQNTAFIATDSIWITRNIHTPTPAWNFLYFTGVPIKAIAACKADSNVFYAVTNNNHVIRWDNVLSASPSYTTLSTPAATNVMASITTDKYNPNIVFLSCGNTIYRSLNKGVSWTNITSTLPAYNILKIIADDYSPAQRLFVSAGSYVYYKDSTTTTWTLTNGLPTVAQITDMMVYNDSTSASILRLSTYGRGAWECDIQAHMPPSGSLTSTKQYLCPGDTIRYYKSTYGNISSFSWSFPGGTPATSTLDSPLVAYPATGTYSAYLDLTGLYGSDTVTRVSYINVSNGTASPVTEGFEGATFPPAQWTQMSQSGAYWQQTTAAGGYGLSAQSILFDNYNVDAGGKHDRIITPKLDLTSATAAQVKFDVAYSYYPGYRDTLIVEVSTDCGRTFTPIYLKDTTWLATAPDTTNLFIPSSAQWRTDSISLSAFLGNSIEIAFDNVGHYGQELYIDNVNISIYTPTSVAQVSPDEKQMSVFPNPTNGLLTINAEGLGGNSVIITCQNLLGTTLLHKTATANNGKLNTSLDLSALPKGIYLVRVQEAAGASMVRKVVLQ